MSGGNWCREARSHWHMDLTDEQQKIGAALDRLDALDKETP